MSVVVINKVSEEWGALGNMSKHEIILCNGTVWPRAEHLFQALRLSCPFLRQEIQAISNPMAAKMRAKKLRKENPDKVSVEPLGEQDLQNMRMLLTIKIDQHPDVKELLRQTGTREIVEDATRRQKGSGLFWGAARQGDGTWKGKNWLGRLWMELRGELFG